MSRLSLPAAWRRHLRAARDYAVQAGLPASDVARLVRDIREAVSGARSARVPWSAVRLVVTTDMAGSVRFVVFDGRDVDAVEVAEACAAGSIGAPGSETVH